VLALGGYLFTRSENRATQVATERRAQDEAVQAYLKEIGELLLDRNLRAPKEGEEERILARARTVTAFKRLDSEHNQSILHFLRDSQLIGDREHPIINFNGTNLRGADLRDANLSGVILSDTDLRYANMGGARLSGANLSGADLSGANLFKAAGWFADLRKAKLSEADLRGADLSGADLRSADLQGASLNLRYASELHPRGDRSFLKLLLRGDWGSFMGSFLESFKITLRYAFLRTDVLAETSLTRAKLQGATMPNGQKYAQWLRTPEGENWQTTKGDADSWWRKGLEDYQPRKGMEDLRPPS
jgi:uncharacterized protein YjbI with pentapeptide repeats